MDPIFTFSLEAVANPQDVQLIHAALGAYNRQQASNDNFQPLNIFLRSGDGTIVGGLVGETYWGWLHVDILWLADSVRQHGFGSQMLAAAEQEAIRRGCRHAHLDTMSFQAQGFYEKHGYSVFGVLDDLPEGHQRIYLKKDLTNK